MYNAYYRLINHLLVAVALSCLFFAPSFVNAQTTQTVADGGTTTPITFPNTGCLYKWTNSNSSIGLAATGAGDIASFTAKNDGYSAVTATITGTPTPAPPYGYQSVGNTLAVIDLNNYSQIATIPLTSPALLGVSADGNILYFRSGADTHTIYKVGASNNKVLGSFPVSPGFGSLVFGADGKKIYTYSAQSHAMVIINAETETVENVINLDPTLTYSFRTVSPDGSKLYLLTDKPTYAILTIVNTATNSFSTANVTRSVQLALTPDGSKLYIYGPYSGYPSVSVYDVAIGAVTVLPINEPITASIMTPDGSQVYFYYSVVPGSSSIFAVNVKTGTVTNIKIGFDGVFSPVLTPDGAYLYIAEDGVVKVLSTATNTFVKNITMQLPKNVTYHHDSGEKMNYDGSRMYVTNYIIKDGAPKQFISVIDTKTNKVIDSIPQPLGTQPFI
jgi:YVTN family beta-propeller protein